MLGALDPGDAPSHCVNCMSSHRIGGGDAPSHPSFGCKTHASPRCNPANDEDSLVDVTSELAV